MTFYISRLPGIVIISWDAVGVLYHGSAADRDGSHIPLLPRNTTIVAHSFIYITARRTRGYHHYKLLLHIYTMSASHDSDGIYNTMIGCKCKGSS